jgi:hypothetical protein
METECKRGRGKRKDKFNKENGRKVINVVIKKTRIESK